ncbi:transcriptional regulator opi1 [Dispira parvispora]|uniref:Transcriptional regulator opi1 n=1 Tax=Dispira parvispora TaxID=1520584 RepID=A0A9W8AT03_9FUNG|nr:transcriptional regulator opi1 [Dispira parvispora]
MASRSSSTREAAADSRSLKPGSEDAQPCRSPLQLYTMTVPESRSSTCQFSTVPCATESVPPDVAHPTPDTKAASTTTALSVRNLCHADSTENTSQVSTNPAVTPSDEHLAAEALGQLSTTPLPSPGDDFMTRVSSYPLVNSALRLYQSSKANSRMVKYGAETVESSVRTIWRPVRSRFESNLVDLDDFACKQLDKIEHHYMPQTVGASSTDLEPSTSEQSRGCSHRSPSMTATATTRDVTSLRKRTHFHRDQEDQEAATVLASTSVMAPEPGKDDGKIYHPEQRSWWQQMLVGAGTGAVVFSEESLRRIKYCLDWLHYAANHIRAQIDALREVIQGLQRNTLESHEPVAPTDNVPRGAVGKPAWSPLMAKLVKTKRDIVVTLKKVIGIVSQYAGAALPIEARRHVRNLIMGLPNRWATIDPHGIPGGSRSGSASPAFSSPSLSPSLTSSIAGASPRLRADPRAHSEANARKVLNFATESHIMLGNVQNVFQEIHHNAENLRQRIRDFGFNVNDTASHMSEDEPASTEMAPLGGSSTPSSPIQRVTTTYVTGPAAQEVASKRNKISNQQATSAESRSPMYSSSHAVRGQRHQTPNGQHRVGRNLLGPTTTLRSELNPHISPVWATETFAYHSSPSDSQSSPKNPPVSMES